MGQRPVVLVLAVAMVLAAVPGVGAAPLDQLAHQGSDGNETNETVVDPTTLPASTFWAFTIVIVLMIAALLIVFFLPSRSRGREANKPLRSDDGEE